MAASSNENHPFFENWRNVLQKSGFEWPTNEDAQLLKLTMNNPSFKNIMFFFSKRRQELFKESSSLNLVLFLMFSYQLNFFDEKLQKEFQPLVETFFKKDSITLKFFQKHFLVLKRSYDGHNLDIYYSMINKTKDIWTEEEWVLEIPRFVYAFMFFFDDEQKKQLSHEERAKLFIFEEIDRIDFSHSPNPITKSIECSNFSDLDLVLVGADLAIFSSKIIILYEREKERAYNNSQEFADYLLKLDDSRISKKHMSEVWEICNQFMPFSRDLTHKESDDEMTTFLKVSFKSYFEEFEKKWDFSRVPIQFAISNHELLICHNEQTLRSELYDTCQKLYQSLLRVDKISSGYEPNQEENENNVFSNRERFLGRDIRKAMEVSKKLFSDNEDFGKGFDCKHIVQHMAFILSNHDKITTDDFTKLLYDIDKGAALTFLYAFYGKITNVYDWWLLWKGFTYSQLTINEYMKELEDEYRSLQKDREMKENIEESSSVAKSSNE